jgi:propanol-preferring alcohol dehydrogenase
MAGVIREVVMARPMHAMRLEQVGRPLLRCEVAIPEPGPGEVLLSVCACAVCRTDLHVVDGELGPGPMPIVPGHEVVGRILATGPGVDRSMEGRRVGAGWLASACGTCAFCRAGLENLCDRALFNGFSVNGGYATHMLARADFVYDLPDTLSDVEAAPLLCAGVIGYRAYAMAGEGRRMGLYGFGAAAHLLAQVARADGREVYVFTRPGDIAAQAFARSLGAVWTGGSDEASPEPLDSALLFAPVGALVPKALADIRKGGTVVCAGIHMSDIPSFPYSLLWGERQVRSVANLTRENAIRFLARAASLKLDPETHVYPLEDANRALDDLRNGRFNGAAVLVPGRAD